MTKKILYFVENVLVTEAEVAEIDKLNETRFIVNVVNASEDIRYGVGRRIPCDFVAGTIPEAYRDIPVFDIDSLPEPGGPDIVDGQIIHVRNYTGADSHQGIAVVAEDDTLTGVNLGATTAMVDGTDTLPVEGGGTITLTVANGVITNVVYSGAILDGQNIIVRNNQGADLHVARAVIINRRLAGVNLGSDSAIVDHDDIIPLKNGKNVKLSVKNSVITGATLCP